MLMSYFTEMLLSDHSKLVEELQNIILNRKNINYLNYIQSLENDTISIYYSPEMKYRMVFLNTIISCLSEFNFSNDELTQIIKNISDVYSSDKLVFMENSKYTMKNIFTRNEELLKNNLIEDIINKLTFLDNEMMNKVIGYCKKTNTLTDDEYSLFELQIFTFASVFMNIDKLLYLICDINK